MTDLKFKQKKAETLFIFRSGGSSRLWFNLFVTASRNVYTHAYKRQLSPNGEMNLFVIAAQRERENTRIDEYCQKHSGWYDTHAQFSCLSVGRIWMIWQSDISSVSTFQSFHSFQNMCQLLHYWQHWNFCVYILILFGNFKAKNKENIYIWQKGPSNWNICADIYLTKRRVSVIQDLIESMLIAVQYIQSIWSSHKCTHMKWLDHLKCSNSVHKTSFTIVIFSVFLDIDHIKLLNVL